MIQLAAQTTEVIDMDAIKESVRNMTPEQLIARFQQCLRGTAAFYAEAAQIVARLKELNVDLTGWPNVSTYLRIASGRLLPELEAAFARSPARTLVGRLPIPDQRRLASNPMVPAIEQRPDGSTDVRMVDLTKEPLAVAKMVLDYDSIRTPDEQRAFLGSQRVKATAKSTATGSRSKAEPLDYSLTVKLSLSERNAIKKKALDAQCSDSDVIRRYLLQTDAFKPPKG